MRVTKSLGRSGHGGHGLIELLFAVGLMSLVVAVLATTRLGPAWSPFDPLAGDGADLAPLEQQLRKLVVEAQESVRVFHPLPGVGATDGLALVNIRGETVLYVLEPSVTAGEPGTLMRVDLDPRRAGTEALRTPFLARVRTFRCAVPPPIPGREPRLVDIELGVELSARSGKGTRPVHLITSIFLRNQESATPDEVFPPGTPLVQP